MLALTALTLLAIIAAVGLAVDAGLLFSARRSLQGIADAAVAAAAQQINVDRYRQTDGQVVELDPERAYAAAVARITAAPTSSRYRLDSYTVSVSTTRVEVTIQGSTRLAFLPAAFLGMARTAPVKARAWAQPRYGIASAQ